MKTSKESIKEQLNDLWRYAQSIAISELDDTDPSGFDQIDSLKVIQTIDKINAALKDKPASKEVKQKLNYAKTRWPAALDKYERQEKILGPRRNSYSKTDADATCMRMKENHMRNGLLKPAYNVQISTNNQYITSYSIHQNPTDTRTLIDHITKHSKNFKQKPNNITADAGYGSEQNYQWLEDKRITAYVMHNQFDRMQNENLRSKKPYATDKLTYDPDNVRYLCPTGKPMKNIGSFNTTEKSGIEQTYTRNQATKCMGCPLRNACHDQKVNPS